MFNKVGPPPKQVAVFLSRSLEIPANKGYQQAKKDEPRNFWWFPVIRFLRLFLFFLFSGWFPFNPLNVKLLAGDQRQPSVVCVIAHQTRSTNKPKQTSHAIVGSSQSSGSLGSELVSVLTS